MKILNIALLLGLFAGCSSTPDLASNSTEISRLPAANSDIYRTDHLSENLTVWSPAHPAASLEEAKNVCEQIREFGLNWSLPTTEQLLKAFNNSNTNEKVNSKYPQIFNDSESSDATFWTSSQDSKKGDFCNSSDTAQVYYVHTGQIADTCGVSPRKFRCIGSNEK